MSDRLKKALRSITAPPRLDYLALYPATVVEDKGNGTVDIQPDDPRIPPMTDIPIRTCLPGMRVKVKRGSRVLLAFEDGDPTRPSVHLWESGNLLAVEVKTQSGYTALIDEEARRVKLSTPSGRLIELDDNAGTTRVVDPSAVVVDAPTVLLAGGGQPIARVGDKVLISGVQPGPAVVEGVIVEGSPRVKSG